MSSIAPAVAHELSSALAEYLNVKPVVDEIDRIRRFKKVASLQPSISNIPQMRVDHARRRAAEALDIPELTAEQINILERYRAAQAAAAPAREQAQWRLRQVFGDGAIPTFCCRSCDGEIEPIHAPRWRTVIAIAAFKDGTWPNTQGSWSGRGSGTVLVRAADLEAVLAPPKADEGSSGASAFPPDAAPLDPGSGGAESVAPHGPLAGTTPAAAIYRTGAAGRPTSMPFIIREHSRRLAAGEAHGSAADEAKCLAAWFQTAHPEAVHPSVKTIKNKIAEDHRRHREKRPK